MRLIIVLFLTFILSLPIFQNKKGVNETIPNYYDYQEKSYLSLDRNYIFNIYPIGNGDRCSFSVKDKDGNTHDVSKVLGGNIVVCSAVDTFFSTSFVGWADNDKFVIDEEKGEIKIVDVKNKELDIYDYDTLKYKFIAVNRTLKYWLFLKNDSKDSDSYIIFDKDKKVVRDNIDFDSNDRGALYDEINDGFLFISRKFSNGLNNYVSVKFDFLELNDFSLKNILTTEPVHVIGMGCDPEYLISKPGEIILTQGCLRLASKYLGEDGNIHIRLND